MAKVSELQHWLLDLKNNKKDNRLRGVPRNMTLERQNKGRLWSYNKFVAFSCKILELIIPKYDLRGISKMWSAFFVFWYYRRWRISFRIWQLKNPKQRLGLISPGILNVQKIQTTFILEMPGTRRILWLLFKNRTW